MTEKKQSQLGKLPTQYTFFLNPYIDTRFSSCPQCEQRTRVRKHPFFIHVDPGQPIVLNMSGRYCPHCDLLILHQDKVEELLAATLTLQDPDLIGNEYLIVGTVERKGWRQVQQEPHNLQVVFDNLHDFEKVVKFKPAHYGWG